ncbi:MAG: methyltransferase domain-containing protein [Candidatus Saccharimonadales bacterium]
MNISNKAVIDSRSEFSEEDLKHFGDDGDLARQELIDPAILQMLGDVKGLNVLDAGCGNGYLSRKLARRGGIVTGIEPATSLFEYCVGKEREENLGITYFQQDLANLDFVEKFDKILAINVLMDIPDYFAALKNCVRVLKKGGDIIISMLHPAFPGFESNWQKLGHVEISEYFNPSSTKQRYGYLFMRPISTYLNDLIALGCVITSVDEPRLADNTSRARNAHVPQFLIIQAKKQ